MGSGCAPGERGLSAAGRSDSWGRSRPGAGDWLLARARLERGALARSSAAVREAFEHDWSPMQALGSQLRLLPWQLWRYLLGLPGGFAVIVWGRSQYQPGPYSLRGRPVQNVAQISVTDLASGNEQPLHVLGHLIDHQLGCCGEAAGRWLSEGGGVTPAWQQAGQRLGRLFELGYAIDPIAGANVRDYFAQSLAHYCRDRQRLNVADPLVSKWFRTTLWSGDFWEHQAEEA